MGRTLSRDSLFSSRAEYVWVRGHWARGADRWVWREGRWEQRLPGKAWIRGRWAEREGQRVWIMGHWSDEPEPSGFPGRDSEEAGSDSEGDDDSDERE